LYRRNTGKCFVPFQYRPLQCSMIVYKDRFKVFRPFSISPPIVLKTGKCHVPFQICLPSILKDCIEKTGKCYAPFQKLLPKILKDCIEGIQVSVTSLFNIALFNVQWLYTKTSLKCYVRFHYHLLSNLNKCIEVQESSIVFCYSSIITSCMRI
jgi:hypothetical protein